MLASLFLFDDVDGTLNFVGSRNTRRPNLALCVVGIVCILSADLTA